MALEQVGMKKPLARYALRAVAVLALGLLTASADAQINTLLQTDSQSRAPAARFRQAGELTIADRYGKKARIAVVVSSPANATHRADTFQSPFAPSWMLG